MSSYGFDNRKRLLARGNIPPEIIFDLPDKITDLVGRITNIEYAA